jgi:uncharacterized membrane protein YphA (DoxX/SURF4 family)
MSAIERVSTAMLIDEERETGQATHTKRGQMRRTLTYWGTTSLVAIVALLAGFAYLTTAPQSVENFRHVGYPQQLRVLLGIAKLAGAITLLLPRLPTLKEWAYAGFTFMWIAASVAHYLAGDGALVLLPIALIGSLAVSYVTRPANRRGFTKSMLVQGDGSTPLPASVPYGGIEDLRVR